MTIITRHIHGKDENEHLERQDGEQVESEVSSHEVYCSAQGMSDQTICVERRMKTNYVPVTPSATTSNIHNNNN